MTDRGRQRNAHERRRSQRAELEAWLLVPRSIANELDWITARQRKEAAADEAQPRVT